MRGLEGFLLGQINFIMEISDIFYLLFNFCSFSLQGSQRKHLAR